MTFPHGALPAGDVRSAEWDGRSLRVRLESGGILDVCAWAPDLVRVEVSPPGVPPNVGWAIARPQAEWPRDFPVEFQEQADALWVRTPALAVRVARRGAALRVQAPGHPDPIAEDVPEGGLALRGEGVWMAKRLRSGERIFGLGEKTGWMDRRGRRLVMWNTDVLPHLPDTDPLYQSIPFLLVESGGRFYGLFVHNTHRTVFDLGHSHADRLVVGAQGGRLEYFVLTGPDLQQVVSRYTELTGRMPLPPLWALGFHQSRWGYRTAAEVREVAAQLRRREIPCDAIYLDIDYMDEYRVFTWDPRRFPDPEGLLGELAGQGFRVVAIVDPGVKVEAGYPVYEEGLREGYFCTTPDGEPFRGQVWPGQTVWPDFARAEVRRWWVQLHEGLLKAGVSGIWCDMNEPANFRHPLPTGSLDPHVQHGPDADRPPEERRRLWHLEFHNLYGMLMSRCAYEAQLRVQPGRRPFVLSRAGFAGIQRWAAVWTGDNASWWEHLAMMVPQLLNLGLSGMALVGADVGGFSGDCTGELLVRWTQAAALTPFFRNHSAIHSRRQEVWQFGPEVEEICRRYIQLRYRLLPYLYALAQEASRTGAPMMRPLFWHYPEDEQAYRLQDEFMVGPHLLVAPVLQPSADHRAVYLPAGEWVHYFRAQRVVGPAWVVTEAPLDELPLWVRAGAALPMGPPVPHTGELGRRRERALWLVAPRLAGGERMVSELYEDDGQTLAYRDGHFAHRRVGCAWTRGQAPGAQPNLELALGPREGSFDPGRPWLDLVVERAGRPPASIEVDGRPADASRTRIEPLQHKDPPGEPGRSEWFYHADLDRLVVRIPETPSPLQVHIRWS